jgi:hypothetical protein
MGSIRALTWVTLSAFLLAMGIAAAQSPSSKTDESSSEKAADTSPEEFTPSKHLSSRAIELPEKYKLDSENGMAIDIKETKDGTDVLLLFYGYRHSSGALKLSRIMMHFPRGKRILSLSDCKEVLYESQKLDCLNGYLVVDKASKKVEIDFVVFDEGDWRRFGWNGVWKYEETPDLDVAGIKENMLKMPKP